MQSDDMILVSTDDHVIEPADMFERHMPKKYLDQAPKYTTNEEGREIWEYDGRPTGSVGLNAVVSLPLSDWSMDPVGHAEMRPACYDADLRVRDMDANGVLAALCFPTFAGFSGMSLARPTGDPELTKAVISAYNDWHIDELSGDHPGRFIPLALVPGYDNAGMVDEINRVAKKGCTAITLPETPYGVRLPTYSDTDYWDPVFKACCDNDLAICMHIGIAFNLIKRPKETGWDSPFILAPQLSAVAATDLLVGGTFKRFPDLRVALSEGGIGWIPFFLDKMDRHMLNHAWTGLEIGPTGMTATEVFQRNFLGCFITDPSALHLRNRIGIENIAWECDYPHSDSTWPRSPESLWEEVQAAMCTDEEIHKLTWQNACTFFRFDPFAHRPREEATVGALRNSATDVDITETTKAEYRRRFELAHSTP
jgi:predicted TIM-barrel fold metal-dependent hydrolase